MENQQVDIKPGICKETGQVVRTQETTSNWVKTLTFGDLTVTVSPSNAMSASLMESSPVKKEVSVSSNTNNSDVTSRLSDSGHERTFHTAKSGVELELMESSRIIVSGSPPVSPTASITNGSVGEGQVYIMKKHKPVSPKQNSPVEKIPSHLFVLGYRSSSNENVEESKVQGLGTVAMRSYGRLNSECRRRFVKPMQFLTKSQHQKIIEACLNNTIDNENYKDEKPGRPVNTDSRVSGRGRIQKLGGRRRYNMPMKRGTGIPLANATNFTLPSDEDCLVVNDNNIDDHETVTLSSPSEMDMSASEDTRRRRPRSMVSRIRCELNVNDVPSGFSDDGTKPGCTYTDLIEGALQDTGGCSVSEIYSWISSRYPYFHPNDDRWKNSIRHNLSIHPVFQKGDKAENGGGHLWTLVEENRGMKANYSRRRSSGSSPTSTSVSGMISTPTCASSEPVITPFIDKPSSSEVTPSPCSPSGSVLVGTSNTPIVAVKMEVQESQVPYYSLINEKSIPIITTCTPLESWLA